MTSSTHISITAASCMLASEAHPPGNLVSGKPWRTDMPTQRAALSLRLRGGSSTGGAAESWIHVSHIQATLYGATIVEVHRGVDPSEPAPWPPLDEAESKRVGSTRIDTLSMFRYKALVAATGTTPTCSATLIPHKDDPLLLPNGGLLELTLLCAWEPTQPLGIEHITVYGSMVPPPAGHSPPSMVPTPVAIVPTKVKPTTPSPAPSPAPVPAPKRPRSDEEDSARLVSSTAAPATSYSTIEHYHDRRDGVVSPAMLPSHAPSPPPLAAPIARAVADPKPLKGCVVVLSGFVNPLRAEIRDKVLTLGATVQNDWGPTCTHLIAAMLNTPKVAQVRSAKHGFIVAKEWALHAFLATARPNEATYRLPGDTSSSVTIVTSADDGGMPPPMPPPPPTRPSSTFRIVM